MGDFYEDERFPDEFKVGSSVGLDFNVDVITSGRNSQTVSRFKRSPYPMRKFNMSKVMLTGEDLEQLQDWLYGMGGPYTGFRLKDWTDYKSCDIYSAVTPLDQFIWSDASTGTVHQLSKEYGPPGKTLKKPVLKPVEGTVRIAVNAVELEEFTDFSVDYTTGIFTLVVEPAPFLAVTAGFEYDTPVIFQDADIDAMAFVTQTATQAGSLRFLELLNP